MKRAVLYLRVSTLDQTTANQDLLQARYCNDHASGGRAGPM